MSESNAENRLLEYYRRYVGDPDRTIDVYAGFGLFFAGIGLGLIGVAVFGFTLSWDELARSSQVMGADNTLPMQLAAKTTTVTDPEIYALGTATTGSSILLVLVTFTVATLLQRRRQRG